MYNIRVEASFSAAHNLRGYKGKCEELHGHNWKVEVVLSKDKLDNVGMVMDFKYLKMNLNKVLEKLDHKYLNNIAYFKRNNPTSENLARYIYGRIKQQMFPNAIIAGGHLSQAENNSKQISGVGVTLKSVTVWESDTSCATYYGQ